MIEIRMDGMDVKATQGEYLLAIARREGIDIPTLCHHEAVDPAGACRLCLVEITKPDWNGEWKIVASCIHPAEDGLVVRTASEKVRLLRKEICDLLLARAPAAERIRALAKSYGIEESGYETFDAAERCILCDICTRVCGTLMTGAISRMKRGIEKLVSTPFGEVSQDCIGCLSCARSCPTGAIEFEEEGLRRTIWKRSFEVVPCSLCGAGTITKEHARWLSSKNGRPEEDYLVCDACKAKKTAGDFQKIGLGEK